MSHEYTQAALTRGDARLFLSHDVDSPASLGQGFVLDEIGSTSGRPAHNATAIDVSRQSSDYSPPLAVRRNPCHYATSNAARHQATSGRLPQMNNYTQVHSHDRHVLGRGYVQHQDESSITGWHTQRSPVTYFTQLEGSSDHLPAHSTSGNLQSRIMPNFTHTSTHSEGSTPNGSLQVAHSGIYLHNGNEVESSHGWSTTCNRPPTFFHAGYNSDHSTLAIPQNNTTSSFIQPPDDEGSMINDFTFSYQGIDQHGVGSIAAVRSTRNHPSTFPQHSSTDLSANSASGNSQDDASPYFDLPTYGGGSTMNNNLQAPRNNVGLFLCDTSEWSPSIGRDNVRYDVQSAAGQFSVNFPFTRPHHALLRHSSVYSIPRSPQNNSVPGGTLRQAPYQMINYRTMYPINDSVRKSVCEWNDGHGPCGEDIIVNWNNIKKHVTSYHLDSRLPINYPTQCRWKNCPLKECIRRDTTARHVCEVHFRIKRLESKGIRNMIPYQL